MCPRPITIRVETVVRGATGEAVSRPKDLGARYRTMRAQTISLIKIVVRKNPIKPTVFVGNSINCRAFVKPSGVKAIFGRVFEMPWKRCFSMFDF